MCVEVIDADDNEMEVGEVGEIAVRLRPNWPVGVFAGYMVSVDLTDINTLSGKMATSF